MNCKMIDVSHWTNVTDFISTKAAGVSGVIVKATQGADKQDPTFLWKIENAIKAGLVIGAYHFFDPLADPVAQAQNFISTCKKARAPMILALDLETLGNAWTKLTLEARCASVQTFLQVVGQSVIGQLVIYCGKIFMMENLPGLDLSAFKLWVVDYEASPFAPRLPQFWTNWSLWQKTGNDVEPGILNFDDLDEFNGNLPALRNLACVFKTYDN